MDNDQDLIEEIAKIKSDPALTGAFSNLAKAVVDALEVSVKMQSRLRGSIKKLDESTSRYSIILIILTIVLVLVGIASIFSSSTH